MKHNHHQQGSAAVKGIVVVAAILIVGGAAAYFLSDPFRTKTQAAYQQFSEWTPENIAADPINYLNFCETQVNEAMQKLKAGEIAVAQKKAKLQSMKDDAARKATVGEKTLADLKELYKQAEADASFPVPWNGQDRTQEFMKKQIVATHTQTQGQAKLRDQVDAGLKQLDVQSGKIVEQRAQCQQQLATIATNREMLKVQEITDDLTEQLVNMRGMLQATVATSLAASNATDIVSLDQIVAGSEATVDDAEFARILGQ